MLYLTSLFVNSSFHFLWSQNISMSDNILCFIAIVFYVSPPLLPRQQFYILVPEFSPCLSSTGPDLDTKDPSSSEIHPLLSCHRPALTFLLRKELWDLVPGTPEPHNCPKSKSTINWNSIRIEFSLLFYLRVKS